MNTAILIGKLKSAKRDEALVNCLKQTQNSVVINAQIESKKKFDSGKYYTSYFDCCAWGKTAERLATMEGLDVVVTAEPTQDRFEVNGEKRKAIKFNVKDIQELEGSSETAEQATQDEYAKYAQPEFDDTDIPF